MRHQLQPLEGGLVVAIGRIHQKTYREGTADVLLKNVKLHHWDGSSALTVDQTNPSATTDHLWLRMAASGCKSNELLSTTMVIGRVGWYARACGTIDLGVTALVAHDLDALYWLCYDLIEHCRWSGLGPLRTAVDAIDFVLERGKSQGKEIYLYSRYYTLADCIKRLTRIRLQLSRTLEANESRLATAPKTGPCTKFREADPFFTLKRGRGRKEVAA
jgi:hypothetical protein